jgi:hypothetical protein
MVKRFLSNGILNWGCLMSSVVSPVIMLGAAYEGKGCLAIPQEMGAFPQWWYRQTQKSFTEFARLYFRN